MNKSSACLFFFLLAALGGAQDLTKPITYRTVAEPLHVALEELSKQAGIKLICSDQLQEDPIILSLRAAPLQGTMDHIAAAIGAEWEKRSQTEFLLQRTDALAANLSKQAANAREASIKQAIDRLTRENSANLISDAELQKTAISLAGALTIIENDPRTKRGYVDGRTAQTIALRAPAHHALISLLSFLPTRRLAEIEPGDKIVFSTKANALQKQLPDDAQAIAEEFVRKQNIFAADFKKARPAPLQGVDYYSAGSVLPVPQGTPRLVLIFQRSPFSRTPTVKVVVVTPDGSVVGSAEDRLSTNSPAMITASEKATAELAANQPDISLSEDSKEVQAARTAAFKNGPNVSLSPHVRELLFNPDKHEPLSFVVSDSFLALADDSQTNLVASPTEWTVNMDDPYQEEGPYKLATFLRELAPLGMTVMTEGGWTIAKPADQVEEWKRRTNRPFLGDCLREADSRGCILIDTAAKLALSERADLQSGVMEFASDWFGQKYRPYNDGTKNLLRFYADLSAPQLEQLKSGGKLSLSQLTPDQQAQIHTMVYRPNLDLEAPNIDGENSALIHEPTEFLPTGLSSDVTVSMTTQDQDVLFTGMRSDDYDFSFPTDINGIGFAIAMYRAQTSQQDAGLPNPSGFHGLGRTTWIAPGHSHELFFNFALTSDHGATGSLSEVVCSDQRWTLDTLPQDLKEKLKTAIAAAQTQMEETHQADPQKPTPPR